MGKRYIVTEDTGCGCGCGGCMNFILVLIVISILASIAPYLIVVALVILLIWLFVGYPKRKQKKWNNVKMLNLLHVNVI